MSEEDKSLLVLRDKLLPGLQSTNQQYGDDYESDIYVDFSEDELVLEVYRISTKKLAKDTLTRSSIDKGLGEFRPKLVKLFEDLK